MILALPSNSRTDFMKCHEILCHSDIGHVTFSGSVTLLDSVQRMNTTILLLKGEEIVSYFSSADICLAAVWHGSVW